MISSVLSTRTEAEEHGVLRAVSGPFPIDISEYLTRARTTPELHQKAIALWQSEVGGLFNAAEKKDEGLRISQAGSCGRELWARVKGLAEKEADLKTLLTRFDGGHLLGSWQAALLTVAIEDAHPTYAVGREAVTYFHDVPGHMDIHVYHRETAQTVWVIDFKLTWAARAVTHTHLRNRKNMLQVTSYAYAENAPVFSLYTMSPSTGTKWVKQSDYELSQELYAEAYHDSMRLRKALASEEEPEADPPEKWMCNYCTYALCDYNPHMPEVF